ncbi:MAG: hypothetical protein F4X35_07910 [Alphaproteobacteria bacterium]|nr:hypothetical protein [Alphaproteobacteria bacterium]
MTTDTRYMASPKDYHSRTAELLDSPWIDVVAFVVYPGLVVLLLVAVLVFALIHLRRRTRARADG